MKTIGKTLRALREGKGLLLREVGAELVLDPTILSKIEQDKRMPTKMQVKSLAGIYGDVTSPKIALLSSTDKYEITELTPQTRGNPPRNFP